MPASTPNPRTAGAAQRRPPSAVDLVRTCLWLGVVGFGGGYAVLVQVRDLMVVRRRWLTEREFANTATVAQMLPGGAAANALALVGLRFHRQVGAVLAYVAFILPGLLAVCVLAWAYVRFGVTAPGAMTVLDGFNAAVVGIVASLTIRMVRTAVVRPWQMGVAAGALLLGIGGGASAGEVALLGIAAGLAIDLGQKRARLLRLRRVPHRPPPPVALPDEGEPLRRGNEPARPPREAREKQRKPPPVGAFAPLGIPLGAATTSVASGAFAGLALKLFRTGLAAYGGGFAIIPYLQATLVGNQHLLTPRVFADAVAIAKLTPGPVLLLGTFIGYVLRGPVGAALATIAIFSGPFVLVVALGTWLIRLRSRRPVRAALRGLTPAVVGLMGAAAATLGAGLADAPSVAIAAAVTLTMVRFRPNAALVLLLGGVARLAMKLAGM